jgi:hypothetical protein
VKFDHKILVVDWLSVLVFESNCPRHVKTTLAH